MIVLLAVLGAGCTYVPPQPRPVTPPPSLMPEPQPAVVRGGEAPFCFTRKGEPGSGECFEDKRACEGARQSQWLHEYAPVYDATVERLTKDGTPFDKDKLRGDVVTLVIANWTLCEPRASTACFFAQAIVDGKSLRDCSITMLSCVTRQRSAANSPDFRVDPRGCVIYRAK